MSRQPTSASVTTPALERRRAGCDQARQPHCGHAADAYGVGGVAAVGLAGLVRTLPAGILAPALSSLADRLPRHRVLLGIHAGRGALVGLAAISLAAGGPSWVVFALAALEGLLGVLHRPTYMTLMPSLARAPEELVASNAASGTMEGIGTLVGPAVGGVLIALAAPWVTFAVPAVTFFVAAAIVLGIRPPRSCGSLVRPSAAGR